MLPGFGRFGYANGKNGTECIGKALSTQLQMLYKCCPITARTFPTGNAVRLCVRTGATSSQRAGLDVDFVCVSGEIQ